MANGFNKSFTEAFTPALIQGQKGAQESLLQSQKTEKEQEKIAENLKRFQSILNVVRGGDTEVSIGGNKKRTGDLILETIGQQLSQGEDFGQAIKTANSLSELFERQTPEEKQAASLRARGVDVPGSRISGAVQGQEQGVSLRDVSGQQLAGQQAPEQQRGQRAQFSTELSDDPIVRAVQEADLRERSLDIQQNAIKKETEAEIKRNIDNTDKAANFSRTVSLFKNLVSQVKGKGEEQGGLGLIEGFLGDINTTFKNPNFSRTASFPGQRVETALSLNNILTGQNRVIKGVLEMINETLPTSKDPESFVANKIDQSLRNSFGILKAFEKAGISNEFLESLPEKDINFEGQKLKTIDLSEVGIDVRKLVNNIKFTEEEEKLIDAIVDEVLAAPASEPKFFTGPGEGQKEINLKNVFGGL